MKINLRDFQATATERLYALARLAKQGAQEGLTQAVVLASPTGSGKTIIVTALMERLADGYEEHAPDDDSVFLWLSDQLDLNEQSRRKILAASTTFTTADLVTLDSSFDQERFTPRKIYFLNIQKLARNTNLVTRGDGRRFTIWDTISNTAHAIPASFWVILDEAHRGMLQGAEAQLALTIAQKFIKGSPGETPPIPLILGISATPERFIQLLAGTPRSRHEHPISPEEIRASGLLKQRIILWHPTDRHPSEWSLLAAASERLNLYRDQWSSYCRTQGEPVVNPVLVVQVEDAAEGKITRTDILEAIRVLEEILGPLSLPEMAHSFQTRDPVRLGNRVLRYVSPPDIQDDPRLRVVFFKSTLNTGWDCPRAEVIMSFRRAVDYTHIAQLVGRLVRTPLARTIDSNEFLNSVGLYLPHYDANSLNKIIAYLTTPDTGVAAPPEVFHGEDTVELVRNPDKVALFNIAATLPTYNVERARKTSNVRRLIRLGRALTHDNLDSGAQERFKSVVVSTLNKERRRLERTTDLTRQITLSPQINLRAVTVQYASDAPQEEAIETVAALARDIDDLHNESGRKLGEGLHMAYLKARVDSPRSSVSPSRAKLELALLLNDDNTQRTLEAKAQAVFQQHIDKHAAAIRHLSEPRRNHYRDLRRLEDVVQQELELPEIQQIQRGQRAFARHLYVDQDGVFACTLNLWETAVIDEELANQDVLGWLRNEPRKPWALTIPYTLGPEKRPMYPDFLVFRKQGDEIVADILDPHSLSQADAIDKAKGLAEFARQHGDKFGRIELIIKPRDEPLRLDLNRDSIRDRVLNLTTNQQLAELFETAF